MKRVHFFTDKTKIADYCASPVRHNWRNLFERGYRVSFFYRLSPKCLACDILLLGSKAVFKLVNEQKVVIEDPSPTLDLLRRARQYATKIIWMDTSDSTSVTHFELLPYVDVYLKKQLFKEKTMYKKHFYGGRIFTDYYYQEFGIVDSQPFEQFFPLCSTVASKVNLSWHIGFGDMYNAFNRKAAIRRAFPRFVSMTYNPPFTPHEKSRSTDIFIRTDSNLSRELVAYHRKELIRRLDAILSKPGISGSTNGEWLSTKEFRNAMMCAKILPSPFGWGELGVRDFEAFLFGAALLKPDISYMETWPPLFIAGETYQPFKWSFDDLESAIFELLQDDDKRREVANNGQMAYRDSISADGMERFCDWFVQQIELDHSKAV